MKKKSLSRVILGLFAMIILRGEECRPELTKDPGFDQWCGNKLCGWEVEKGSIGKVATWHRRDHGVALLGEEVVLGQLLEAGDDPPDCLVFELLVRYFPQQDGD
ncbi:MAG: hypothetical protein FJ125_08795, partial [Deltaproteobacteria bacterium]|nr:hypothetical protein [Deltaproteobacteria bacterium]